MLKTIKDNLKYLFLKLIALKNSGGSGPNGPGVRILIFHNVKKDLWPRFRSLVEHINEKYGFLTPAEAEDYFSGKSNVAGVKFLLSFDDGFMADAELFKEVLEPAGLKALFFVCPGFVGLDGKDATDFVVNNLFAGRISRVDASNYLPMGWEEIGYLRAKGNTIGAHTLRHVRLASITAEKQKENEIVGSKKALTDRLGNEIEWFAYPFGDIESIDRGSLEIIKNNYRFCCSGLRGININKCDPHGLSRDAIDLNAPLEHSKLLVSGLLDRFYSGKIGKLKEYLRA